MTDSQEKKKPNHLKKWCEMTGWHGILDCYQAEHLFWKLFWLLLVLGGCFLALNQCVSMVLDFTSDGQWMTSVTYEAPEDIGLDWPNITICGLGWGVLDEAFLNASLNSSDESAKEALQAYDQLNLDLALNNTGIDTCSKILIACGYSNILAQDISSIANTDLNCCDTGNVNRRGMDKACFTLFPTVSFGLAKKRQGNHEPIYYILKSKLDGSDIRYIPGSGYTISIFNGNSSIEDDYGTNFYIRPGTRNMLTLTMENHRTTLRGHGLRFMEPTMPCGKRYEYLNSNRYTKNLCQFDCMIQWQVRICKCIISNLLRIMVTLGIPRKELTVPVCDPFQEAKCVQGLEEATSRLQLEDPGDNDTLTIASCSAECPAPCSYSKIEATMSSALFVAPSEVTVLRKFMNKAMAGRNLNFSLDEVNQMTMLELQYETSEIRVVERVQRLNIDELISNIGGSLGVWSGLSILSIVQILVYIFKAVKTYVGPTFHKLKLRICLLCKNKN